MRAKTNMARRKLAEMKKIMPLYLVVCEGAAEEDYVYGVAAEWGISSVEVVVENCGGGGNFLSSGIPKAIAHKDTYEKRHGDKVITWLLWDLDGDTAPSTADIKKGIALARRNSIKTGLSNPNFGVWYIWHQEQVTAPLTSKEAAQKVYDLFRPLLMKKKQKRINTHLIKFAYLRDTLNNAIDRALRVRKWHETRCCDYRAEVPNPYSGMYDLIMEFSKYKS